MNRGGKKGVLNKFKLREIIKIEFCKKYRQLLYSVPTWQYWQNSEKENLIAELARKEIGYSKKTISQDIVRSIKGFNEKINP